MLISKLFGSSAELADFFTLMAKGTGAKGELKFAYTLDKSEAPTNACGTTPFKCESTKKSAEEIKRAIAKDLAKNGKPSTETLISYKIHVGTPFDIAPLDAFIEKICNTHEGKRDLLINVEVSI